MKSETQPTKLVVLNLPQERDLSGEELKTVLVAIADGINELGNEFRDVKGEIKELKDEMKAWSSWLRIVAGTIIVTVSIAFLGIIIPLAIALWKQTV